MQKYHGKRLLSVGCTSNPTSCVFFFNTTSCVFLHPLFSLILQNLTQHEHFFTHLCNYVSILEQKSLQYLMHHGTNYMDILTFLPLLIISLSMDDLQFTWEFVFFLQTWEFICVAVTLMKSPRHAPLARVES